MKKMTDEKRLALLDEEHEAVGVMLQTPIHDLVDAMQRVIETHDIAEVRQ